MRDRLVSLFWTVRIWAGETWWAICCWRRGYHLSFRMKWGWFCFSCFRKVPPPSVGESRVFGKRMESDALRGVPIRYG